MATFLYDLSGKGYISGNNQVAVLLFLYYLVVGHIETIIYLDRLDIT